MIYLVNIKFPNDCHKLTLKKEIELQNVIQMDIYPIFCHNSFRMFPLSFLLVLWSQFFELERNCVLFLFISAQKTQQKHFVIFLLFLLQICLKYKFSLSAMNLHLLNFDKILDLTYESIALNGFWFKFQLIRTFLKNLLRRHFVLTFGNEMRERSVIGTMWTFSFRNNSICCARCET